MITEAGKWVAEEFRIRQLYIFGFSNIFQEGA